MIKNMSNYEKKRAGLRLKKLREVQTGLSQTQFAKLINYETQNIQALERGKTNLYNVRCVTFINYANGLNIYPNELFDLLYNDSDEDFNYYINSKEINTNE